MLKILFSATLFLAAGLLFWVQLFASKMILPVLGGSASVWNTCMVFFEVALLLGYLYAFLVEKYLSSAWRPFLHPFLLLCASIILPISLEGIALPAPDANPVIWLLVTLARILGPAFLALAGTAPLVQAWAARAGKDFSKDPYFLYAASNIGSLLALAFYPTLVEPHLRLSQQSHLWAGGYFALIGMLALCALFSARAQKSAVANVAAKPPRDRQSVRRKDRMIWILLAFAPSSLLLGVTTHLTMDVASAPLFWVLPLILYLLTFVLAFQRLIIIASKLTAVLQALCLTLLAAVFLGGQSDDILTLFGLHLAAFFFTALLCHQELARLRPHASHLTEFYLWISFGGALGGIFNALLAPLLFTSIAEYPLMLVIACLFRPGLTPWLSQRRPAAVDFLAPLFLLSALVAIDRYTAVNFEDLNQASSLMLTLLACLALFSFNARPFRFALGLAAMIVAGSLIGDTGDILFQTRNFYGVLKVAVEDHPATHALYNGTTLHGTQSQDPATHMRPLSYYHPEGPLGHVFKALEGSALTRRVGVIGLGAGAIACYEKPYENWTYFEINAADIAIAENPRYFTFLKDCRGHPTVTLGDARLSLAATPDQTFDMLIFDAFSSDSIPIHLITAEAMALYLSKLKPHGLLLFHISNRYLDLAPVLGNIAASLDLTARIDQDEDDGDDESDPLNYGKAASDWVMITADPSLAKTYPTFLDWRPIKPDPEQKLWTDDYSNLLGILIH